MELSTISVVIPCIFIFIHIVAYLTLRTKSVTSVTYCEPYIILAYQVRLYFGPDFIRFQW
jgi:hypothetical protein